MNEKKRIITRLICCVEGCNIQTKKTRFSVFRFPKDLERAKEWRKVCNLERNPVWANINVELLSESSLRVCEDHFEAKLFLNNDNKQLQLNSIPTKNLFSNVEIKVEELDCEEPGILNQNKTTVKSEIKMANKMPVPKVMQRLILSPKSGKPKIVKLIPNMKINAPQVMNAIVSQKQVNTSQMTQQIVLNPAVLRKPLNNLASQNKVANIQRINDTAAKNVIEFIGVDQDDSPVSAPITGTSNQLVLNPAVVRKPLNNLASPNKVANIQKINDTAAKTVIEFIDVDQVDQVDQVDSPITVTSNSLEPIVLNSKNVQRSLKNLALQNKVVNIHGTKDQVNEPKTINTENSVLKKPSTSGPIRVKTNLKRTSEYLEDTEETDNKKSKVTTTVVMDTNDDYFTSYNKKVQTFLKSLRDNDDELKAVRYSTKKVTPNKVTQITQNSDNKSTPYYVRPCGVKGCEDKNSLRFKLVSNYNNCYAPEMRFLWKILTGNEDLTDEEIKVLPVCENHFEKTMINNGKLVYGARPILKRPNNPLLNFCMLGEMEKRCDYLTCMNEKRKSAFYFRYPQKRVFQWRLAAGRVKNENNTSFANRFICSDHFDPDYFYKKCTAILKKNATPNIYKDSQAKKAQDSENVISVEEKKQDGPDETIGVDGENCSVINCPIKGMKTRFRYPKDLEMWRIWVKNVLLDNKLDRQVMTDRSWVCAFHFDYKMFTSCTRKQLRKDAFPSVNLCKKDSENMVVEYDLYSIREIFCVYRNCESFLNKNSKYFSFPYNLDRWNAWNTNSGANLPLYSRKNHYDFMICQKHFEPDDFYNVQSKKLLSRKANPIPWDSLRAFFVVNDEAQAASNRLSTFVEEYLPKKSIGYIGPMEVINIDLPDKSIKTPLKTIEVMDSEEEAEAQSFSIFDWPNKSIKKQIKTFDVMDSEEEAEANEPCVIKEIEREQVNEPYCKIIKNKISFPHWGKAYQFNDQWKYDQDICPMTCYQYVRTRGSYVNTKKLPQPTFSSKYHTAIIIDDEPRSEDRVLTELARFFKKRDSSLKNDKRKENRAKKKQELKVKKKPEPFTDSEPEESTEEALQPNLATISGTNYTITYPMEFVTEIVHDSSDINLPSTSGTNIFAKTELSSTSGAQYIVQTELPSGTKSIVTADLPSTSGGQSIVNTELPSISGTQGILLLNTSCTQTIKKTELASTSGTYIANSTKNTSTANIVKVLPSLPKLDV